MRHRDVSTQTIDENADEVNPTASGEEGSAGFFEERETEQTRVAKERRKVLANVSL